MSYSKSDRQTEGVFGVHVCSLLSPPLHSVERLFTCNRSGISSFFPINGQNSISWGVAGVILEKRENCTKLYLSIFFRAVSWREADEFSSKQIFQNLTPESVSPHLPPSTTQLSILIPCSPQSVYFPPVQNICLFLSFSVSLTVSFSFRLACFGWDDLYFLLFSALWMEGRGGGAKPKIIVKALLKWVVSCYFVPREREKPFIIA